ncbi:VOC family protein [uncultured Marixanthomonas sp.]|uniref:VOC family protein n=1 Tax=uncultured Marixanthomonas sp. TaxID=757245 RepID=UPI0030D9F1F2|tara:strand:+ start:23778 stop:24083 length:306 start_codon:yes stop_codon:yes gene_type:complete
MGITNSHINYIELKANDLEAIKEFYSTCFGWSFTDYGPTYIAFSDSGLQGGFEKMDTKIGNGALVVLYHSDLEQIKKLLLKLTEPFQKIFFPSLAGNGFIF